MSEEPSQPKAEFSTDMGIEFLGEVLNEQGKTLAKASGTFFLTNTMRLRGGF